MPPAPRAAIPGGAPMPSRGWISRALCLPASAAFWAALAVAAAAGAPAHPGRPNVVALKVRTPHGGFNRMVVTVTVCEPGTERCAAIDDVMVDTGSTGLRLEASAVPPRLRLPAFPGPDGRPLAECLRFLHDRAWGPLVRADLRIGGLAAPDLPVQVIDDGGRSEPEECPHSDVRPTSNGTLGIGPHLWDCGGGCEQDPGHPTYFACEAGGCAPVPGRVASAYRVPNPVSRFPGHDEGVVFDLPAPPPGGAGEVAGTLTFGVEAGDLGAAPPLRLDRTGRFTTLHGGRAYPDSFIDSGTETYILADGGLPRCAGMDWAFCAVPEARRDAVMVGRDGARVPVSFGVGDYRGIRERQAGAAAGLAVAADPSTTAFVWGAPFFLGRRVALVLDGRTVLGTPGLEGPFYAFRDRPPP